MNVSVARRSWALGVALLLVALTVPVGGPVRGHAPDPVVGGELFTQDQRVEYRWKSGQVPPAWMQSAVHDAARGSNESRSSKAALFAYDSGGSSTVSYSEPSGCGTNGIACFNRGGAPRSFTMAFRRQGHAFDWGTLKWCQYYDSPPNGCYDVENVALDEFGHVLILGHHQNYADDSDYLDAVVQTFSRTRPRTGWNVDRYGRCDTATLQRRYDVRSSSDRYSTCLALDTVLSLRASSTSVSYRGNLTLTATLQVADGAGYGKLAGNPLSGRTVTVQRRVPGGSSWTSLGDMDPGGSAGTYVYSSNPTTTWEWRAVFASPSNEGLDASRSGGITVRVTGCSGTCPIANQQ